MRRHATHNDVKVYNVSAGKSMPEWTQEQKKKNTSLRYNEEYRKRIELMTDFDFPTACSEIKVSADEQYIFATGTYKPRMKIFEVSQVSMKCERFMDTESVTFETLSDDYQKVVFLRTDRMLEFHVKYGRYYTTRLPRFGRDLTYSKRNCELYCACSGKDVYRLHLEQGRFMKPFETQCPAVNSVDLNLQHQLVGCGGSDGRVECWDQRQRVVAGSVNVTDALFRAGLLGSTAALSPTEVSIIKFADDGLTFGCGTSDGHCLLFDLRSSKPLHIKTHNYGLPINTMTFCEEHNMVTADTKVVKIWNRDDGHVITNVEPPADINKVTVWPNSGLMFMAAETTKIQTFYVPALGIAPKWCRFLDSLTEEMEEEEKSTVYDDYKFVTKEELSALALDNLVGTPALKAYMHGYFMDMRLYTKAKAIAKPFAYETYRDEQIDKKIQQQREDRIAPLKRLPKVNTKLAARILSGAQTKAGKKENTDSTALMKDDRFASLWNNSDFAVDEKSDEFARVNPSTAAMAKAARLKRVDESDEEVESKPDNELDTSQFEDPEGAASDSDDSEEDEEAEAETVQKREREPKLMAVKDGHEGMEILRQKKRAKKQNSTFEARLESQERKAKEKKKQARDEAKALREKKKNKGKGKLGRRDMPPTR